MIFAQSWYFCVYYAMTSGKIKMNCILHQLRSYFFLLSLHLYWHLPSRKSYLCRQPIKFISFLPPQIWLPPLLLPFSVKRERNFHWFNKWTGSKSCNLKLDFGRWNCLLTLPNLFWNAYNKDCFDLSLLQILKAMRINLASTLFQTQQNNLLISHWCHEFWKNSITYNYYQCQLT